MSDVVHGGLKPVLFVLAILFLFSGSLFADGWGAYEQMLMTRGSEAISGPFSDESARNRFHSSVIAAYAKRGQRIAARENEVVTKRVVNFISKWRVEAGRSYMVQVNYYDPVGKTYLIYLAIQADGTPKLIESFYTDDEMLLSD